MLSQRIPFFTNCLSTVFNSSSLLSFLSEVQEKKSFDLDPSKRIFSFFDLTFEGLLLQFWLIYHTQKILQRKTFEKPPRVFSTDKTMQIT